MKKIFLFLVLSLSLLSPSNYTFDKFVAGQVLLEPDVAPNQNQIDCGGKASDCAKATVRYIGKISGCYCYACYISGKRKIICTKDQEENKKLQKMIKPTGKK